MNKSHLDLFWKNISSLPYFRGFLRAVEGRYYQDINMTQPILDLGIGDGHFNSVTFPNLINVGIDPGLDELKESKQKNGCLLHICGFGESLPFRNRYFSTVFSNSVLEHIELLEPVLNEVNRVLKEKGLFIITVPNDNFTQNLSIGRMFNSLRLNRLAIIYQRFFNKISRHQHPDPISEWEKRLRLAGFNILKSWNYFPKESLKILEWGHLFGIPAWFSKKLFGKWVLVPTQWNLWIITSWLEKIYIKDQDSKDGAYTFFILEK
ncbi:MAG: class I SAM-dependent methyltransferase [Pelolinea sp.]|nr:class I SAM-dependent methyltransferase [Pelolinea sp.]